MNYTEVLFFGGRRAALEFVEAVNEQYSHNPYKLKLEDGADKYLMVVTIHGGKSGEERTKWLENIGMITEDTCWQYRPGGSVLGDDFCRITIKGRHIKVWRESHVSGRKYRDIHEYFANGPGCSTEKNVASCITHLAKANNMTLAQFIETFA